MSNEKLVIDENALVSVKKSLLLYLKECRDNIEESLRKLKLNGSDWNDEDFNLLLSAITCYLKDVEELEEKGIRLSQRIDSKISAFHALHSIKF